MIDYQKIADAVKHYSAYGFESIEVPWFVTQESLDVTRPLGTRLFDSFAGCLVASGEQSFIEIRNQLSPGRCYQCVTPCFRDEPAIDELHRLYFIKQELITVIDKLNEEIELRQMIDVARSFFKNYGSPVVEKTDIGHDITINGIEVGSYGIRQHEDFRWVYGTGCAEPRLTQSLG